MDVHPRARFGALFTLAFVLAACSSSSSGDDEVGGNGSAGSSAGSTSNPDGAAGAAGTTIGSSGNGGTSASAGAAGASGGALGSSGAAGTQAVTPADLIQLAVGNQWTFTTTAKPGAIALCKVGTVMNTVNSTDTQVGRMAFEVTSYCGAMNTLSVSDNSVDQLLSGTWVTILQSPVSEGMSWQTPQATYTWHGPLSVQVPAGSFQNCWKRSPSTASLPDVTYCSGIGIAEIDDSTYTTVLTSYMLK